jgi:hypothetical protein
MSSLPGRARSRGPRAGDSRVEVTLPVPMSPNNRLPAERRCRQPTRTPISTAAVFPILPASRRVGSGLDNSGPAGPGSHAPRREEDSMTTADVRAAKQLVDFHARFAPLFGCPEAQDLAHGYLRGLMTCPERKSVEPIAIHAGQGKVSGLQKFINRAPGPPTTSRPRPRPTSPSGRPPRPNAGPSAPSASWTRPASPGGARTAPACHASTADTSARRRTARSASS